MIKDLTSLPIVFETICRELGIEHARGSPEHAQSQGQVERQNQLFANIRAVCNRNPASWPRAMHAVDIRAQHLREQDNWRVAS